MYTTSANNVSQGDARNQRDGNRVYSLGQRYAFTFYNNSTFNINCRMIAVIPRIAYDPDIPSGIATALLFDSNGRGYPLTSYNEAQLMLNPINKRGYRVMMDKTFTIQSNSGADAARNKTIKGYIKTRRILSWDAGESATQPDYPLYFVLWTSRADNDTGVGDNIEVSYMIRHHFKDF